MKHKQIEKIRRDIKHEIQKIEICTIRIEASENKIQELGNKLIEMENENAGKN